MSSLRTRLLVVVGGLAVAAIAGVAFSARQSTRREFERFQVIEHTRASADHGAVLERVAAALGDRCCGPDAMGAATRLLDDRQVVLAFDEDGTMIAGAGRALDRFRVSGQLRGRGGEGNLISVRATTHEGGLDTAMMLSVSGGPSAWVARAEGGGARLYLLTLPRADAENPAAQFLGSVDRRLLGTTSLAALVAIGLTWLLTRRIVDPIVELGRAAQDLASGHLSRRVTVRGRDEVAALAESFNTMAAELERQERLRREMVRDVAHELRTPLTALQCRLETVADGLAKNPGAAVEGIGESVGHLSRLVDDLEQLARGDARELTFAVTDVNLARVCDSAIAAAGLERDARLHRDLDDAVHVSADPLRLRQIVVNLLTNAARYTPEDGRITVRAALEANAVAIIEVHNTGSALSVDELTRVFDRFYRADPARRRTTGGSGLGLAIVKQLAEGQGASVSARSDASGVAFSVRFRTAFRRAR